LWKKEPIRVKSHNFANPSYDKEFCPMLSKDVLTFIFQLAIDTIYEQYCPTYGGFPVKSTLILRLIEAHCSGSEDNFKLAIQKLANDEETKGNLSLAQAVRGAYSPGKQHGVTLETFSPMSEMTFSAQNVPQTPKDKDSALELVEILEPKVRLDDVALPEKTHEMLRQVILEQKKTDDLLSKG